MGVRFSPMEIGLVCTDCHALIGQMQMAFRDVAVLLRDSE